MHWTLTVPETFSLPQIIRRSLNCEQSKLEQFRLLQPPFSANRSKERLNRVERLQSGITVSLTLAQTPAGLIVSTEERLTGKDTEEISQKIRRMLRLGENLQPFLDIARRIPSLETTLQHGVHILRGATFFEDVIKAIILTEEEKTQQGHRITWIVDRFGDPLPSNPTRHAFPTPQQFLAGDIVLRDTFLPHIAGKLVQVAEKFCIEAEHIETVSQQHLSADKLADELMRLFALEPAALELIMLSLGRYDYIPTTPCLQRPPRPNNGSKRREPLRDTRSMFELLQPWGGLACWFWDWSRADSAGANTFAGGNEWRA
jgi:3-methyladenine DNA glycosylase/8-oxoguanine DNA glycosylase